MVLITVRAAEETCGALARLAIDRRDAPHAASSGTVVRPETGASAKSRARTPPSVIRSTAGGSRGHRPAAAARLVGRRRVLTAVGLVRAGYGGQCAGIGVRRPAGVAAGGCPDPQSWCHALA